MNAVTFDALDTPPHARDDLDEPVAGSGQVLVRVSASSANPVDNAIAAGMLAQMVEHDFPVTLGRDYAGVVEAVGDGVGDFAAGDEVFGFLTHANPAVHDGSWAELIAVGAEQSIARAPEGDHQNDEGDGLFATPGDLPRSVRYVIAMAARRSHTKRQAAGKTPTLRLNR